MKRFGATVLSASVWLSLGILCLKADEESFGGISSLSTPWIIAHRGGPMLWPEETMAAYRASTAAGNPFVEVDCHTLSNGAVVLLHDQVLDRTTNRTGDINDVLPNDWGSIRVVGKKLLGPGWGDYPVPYLDEVLTAFGTNKVILVEAKDYESRLSILDKLKTYKISKEHVLVNSTELDRLKPAIAIGYRSFLGLQDMKHDPKALKKAGLWGVACPYPLTETYVQQLKASGLRIIGYTVNRQYQRDELVRWGVDGIPTDDPEYLDFSQSYRRNTDPYETQKWAAGMLEGQRGGRGHFVPPNKWALDASEQNAYKGCLQGWMCPVGGKLKATEWTMDLTVSFHSPLTPDRWASIAVMATDAALNSDAPSATAFGYNILFRYNGGLELIKYSGATGLASPTIGKISGKPIRDGADINYRIIVSPTDITLERLDTHTRLTVVDDAYRGAYVTFGAKGLEATFSNIKLTIP